jgi:hypothetical protein
MEDLEHIRSGLKLAIREYRNRVDVLDLKLNEMEQSLKNAVNRNMLEESITLGDDFVWESKYALSEIADYINDLRHLAEFGKPDFRIELK